MALTAPLLSATAVGRDSAGHGDPRQRRHPSLGSRPAGVGAGHARGRTAYVIHDLGDLDLDPAAAGFDLVISGHSHQPKTETVGGVVYLNPGSAGPRRFNRPITLAMVDLKALPLRPEVCRLIA